MSVGTSPILQPRAEFSGILRDEVQFSSGGNDTADRLNGWYDVLMLQSGTGLSPTMAMLLSVCCGLTLGGLAWVIQENFLSTAFAAMIGFILPTLLLMLARSRRQATMMRQLPPMLEELARAAKTGRSVEQSLQFVASDTPAPLGDELKRASQRLDLGMNLREALADLPHRTGLMTLQLFCMSLGIHQQTGGDLVHVLERLSRTVRDRLSYLGRLRAATAASRATAVLMILIPPAVLAFFIFRDPNYLQSLLSSSWGRISTFIAIALEVVGILWILRVLNDSQRG